MPLDSSRSRYLPILAPLPATGNSSGRTALAQSIRSALAALAAHKLRSALTMVGVIVGVCGVLVVSAVSQLTIQSTAGRFGALGANVIDVAGFVISGSAPPVAGAQKVVLQMSGPPSLTLADMQAIRTLPHVVGVSPSLGTPAQVVAGNQNWQTTVVGALPDIQRIRGYSVKSGAFFTDADAASNATVAVLGQTVANKLFPGANPVGQQMRINSVTFTVVGVLNAIGSNGERDQDDTVLVPASTLLQRLAGGPTGMRFTSGGNAPAAPPNGGPPPDAVVVQAQGAQAPTGGQGSAPGQGSPASQSGSPPSEALLHSTFPGVQVEADSTGNVPGVEAAITKTLEQMHHIAPGGKDDFTVGGFFRGAQVARQSISIITLVMGIVAAIALLLGGFGIANVMLASVTERTREIGVRIAVGAQPRDVQAQFLVEATTLSLLGGIGGILLGLGLSSGLPHVLKRLAGFQAPPSAVAVVVAVLASLLIGVASGYYPARRAAHVDPIQALRHA